MSFMDAGAAVRRRMILAVAALSLAVLSAACQQTTAAQKPVTPSTRPPLVLTADSIVLEERYPAPGEQPGEERNLALTPAGAVRDWVKTRLRADGTPGQIRVILLDARVTRKELAVQKGLKGAFSDDQKYRYDGHLHLRVEYNPVSGSRPSSYAEAEARAFFTVPEGASVNQLEQQSTAMVRDLMLRLELELENNMLRYMPGVLR